MSIRHVLKGKVTDLREGMLMATVKTDVGNGNTLSALIGTEAVKELGVKWG